MLSIRLKRTGRTNWPSYRIVVQEKTLAPASKVIETIGTYDPKTEPAKVETNKERLDHWLKSGARPSIAVAEILVKQDLIKLEDVPELVKERARREASQKRIKEKKAWKDKVAKEIKKRNEAKQKAKADPTTKETKPEKPKEEEKKESPQPQAEAKPEAPAKKEKSQDK